MIFTLLTYPLSCLMLFCEVLNVCACKWVDEVIIGAPMCVTEDLLKTWDIHVVAKGAGHKRNGGEAKDDPRVLAMWVDQ